MLHRMAVSARICVKFIHMKELNHIGSGGPLHNKIFY